jgi:hypothetical protein
MSSGDAACEGLCAQLRALELALLDPAVRRDREQVSALLADDFEEFGSSGRVWSRAAILQLLETEEYSPPAMKDFRCSLLAENVALATYRTVRTDAETGLQSGALRSSLWIRNSAEWKIRFHQGTRLA